MRKYRRRYYTVAELNEEYIARMEDVLALYGKPFSEKEPVVCMDEKPFVLHCESTQAARIARQQECKGRYRQSR